MLLLIKDIVSPDNIFLYLCFTDEALGAIYVVLQGIPTQTAIGRLIPNNIEATMFAALTGIINLTNLYWSKMLGTFINKGYNVTNTDFSNFDKLYLISTICAALPLLFIWVVPTNEEIRRTQRVIKFLDEYDDALHCTQMA